MNKDAASPAWHANTLSLSEGSESKPREIAQGPHSFWRRRERQRVEAPVEAATAGGCCR